MVDATHICTELNTKILKNNYNPDIHVRPFDCGICFMETATVLDTPSSSLSVPRPCWGHERVPRVYNKAHI